MTAAGVLVATIAVLTVRLGAQHPLVAYWTAVLDQTPNPEGDPDA